MDGFDYQKLAARTMNMDLTHEERLANAAMGMTGEAGEVCDIIKKHLHQGHELNVAKVLDECGDVMWYIAEMCEACGFTLNQVMEYNVIKLRKRYPEGFSSEASMNRKE